MGPYLKYVVIYPTFFDLLLLVLALIPTIKESTEMYKATKRWQPSRYMTLIVKEGVFFVLLNLLNNIPAAIIEAAGNPVTPVWYLIRVSFFFWIATTFPVVPRFVLSIRELYDKDTRRCWGEGIDGGFGISRVSVIVFAGVRNALGEESDEEMQLEPIGRLATDL